ncbi:MAG TPA: antitoxin [Mycobacterium sp.]|jgi:hypothetical protein|uniref:antitoxin n=1 Tax=Mycobacterium sp. TaxID=1785 RepID=UPI002F41DEA9
MSTSTTTIRVSIRTRDRLATQARERGISVAALLTELASRAEHEAFFRAERDATRADLGILGVRHEDNAWDTTAGDGLG